MSHSLIKQLHDIGSIQFGRFTLKSGIESPFYIDLRLSISYPSLLREIAEAMWDLVKDVEFDLLCGVPYTALPFATVISLEHNIPMIMRRKEVKSYGTKKSIEGKFLMGQSCLIIEDLVSTGKSVMETIQPLEDHGIRVNTVLSLIDREHGGRENLTKGGYSFLSLLKISDIFCILYEEGRVSLNDYERSSSFLKTFHSKEASNVS